MTLDFFQLETPSSFTPHGKKQTKRCEYSVSFIWQTG